MNIGNAYRRARNALCFEKNLILQLQYKWIILKQLQVYYYCQKWSKKSKNKTQAIPLKFWYRILVPDFSGWYGQIQIDLPN